MKLSHSIKDNVCILSIEGRFLKKEVSEFESYMETLLENSDHRAFLINLKRVNYLTSLGVGMLIIFFKKANERGAPFGFCHVSDEIYKSFQSSNLEKILSIYTTEEEAVANL